MDFQENNFKTLSNFFEFNRLTNVLTYHLTSPINFYIHKVFYSYLLFKREMIRLK